MKTVNTVCGEIQVSQLGFTLSHEHFLMVDNAMRFAVPGWIDEKEIEEQGVKEVNRAMEYGIRTIIDATPINLGRDVHLLRKISERTNVNIIASTGFYYHELPWFSDADFREEEVLKILLHEVEHGIQGTAIRPGFIKCATEDPEISKVNEKFIRTYALLHQHTGLPIMTHANAKYRSGLAQQQLLEKAGVDLSKVIIGHCDDSKEEEYIVDVLKNGSYVGMDRIGVESINPLKNRIDMIERLISLGYGDRIVMSHDCNIYSDCGRVGGIREIRDGSDPKWNYRVIPTQVLPELRRRGVSEDVIEDLTVNNIRRFFENL